MKIFGTFKCSGQILSNSLSQFWNNKSISLQIFYPSSVWWKTIPLYFFSSNNIYFAQKELIKMKIFESFECSSQILSNSLCQFGNNKLISLQILYLSSVSWKIIPLYFFSSNIIYFVQKESIKMNCFLDFWVLGLNFVKFLMPILKWWVYTSPNFVSLFSFMKDYSYVLF